MWNFRINNKRFNDPAAKNTEPTTRVPSRKPVLPPTQPLPSNILIIMDELIAYHNLPSWFLANLPGYQAFSKIGIEFTNIHNNRQMCSPSRASFQTSTINTGIQGNIDLPWQYNYFPNLSYDAETIPKSLKKSYPNIITSYFGKEHLSAQLDFWNNITPSMNINTSGVYKCYGFDRGSMFGDTFYKDGHGFLADNTYFNTVLNNTTTDVDYVGKDPLTNEPAGFIGVIPFLKARVDDKKQFHLQFHINNPHDTQQFWQNFSQIPSAEQLQFFAPFLKEQTTDLSLNNPYYYNEFFPDAFTKVQNLTTNFFEKNFLAYSNYVDLLPFIDSYVGDYSISSESNPINQYYSSFHASLIANFTMPNDSSDIKSWKNLISNYYGLIIEADKYVFKIHNFLRNNNMLPSVSVILTSDHGDLMSAHGIKQKGMPFKECVNVPFVVYSPRIPINFRGTKNNVLGSLLDLAPTIDVLMNIPNKNTNFLGESLIVKNNNNFLIARTQNLPVMHIFNDFMNGMTCLLDPSYNDDFMNFKFCFNMIIDYDEIDGKLYKFGRYYDINEVIIYNFIYNTLIPSLRMNIFSDSRFLKFDYTNELINPSLENLTTFLSNQYNDRFEYLDVYNKIKEVFKSENNVNSLELTLFVNIIINYIVYYTNHELIIPSVYEDFKTILNLDFPHRIDFFCYNITDDYNEVKNIFYKKNEDNTFSYDDSHEELFTRLNEKLNQQTLEQCMTSNNRFTFILPDKMFQLLFLSLKLKQNRYSNLTDNEKFMHGTLFYNNTFDSKFNLKENINTLLEEISNLVSKS